MLAPSVGGVVAGGAGRGGATGTRPAHPANPPLTHPLPPTRPTQAAKLPGLVPKDDPQAAAPAPSPAMPSSVVAAPPIGGPAPPSGPPPGDLPPGVVHISMDQVRRGESSATQAPNPGQTHPNLPPRHPTLSYNPPHPHPPVC